MPEIEITYMKLTLQASLCYLSLSWFICSVYSSTLFATHLFISSVALKARARFLSSQSNCILNLMSNVKCILYSVLYLLGHMTIIMLNGGTLSSVLSSE